MKTQALVRSLAAPLAGLARAVATAALVGLTSPAVGAEGAIGRALALPKASLLVQEGNKPVIAHGAHCRSLGAQRCHPRRAQSACQ